MNSQSRKKTASKFSPNTKGRKEKWIFTTTHPPQKPRERVKRKWGITKVREKMQKCYFVSLRKKTGDETGGETDLSQDGKRRVT